MTIKQIENLFQCDLKKLSNTLKIEINELKDLLQNGSIFVFNNLDHMAQFYTEAELPWKECLKDDLKNGHVVYSQHKFWLIY